MCQTQYDFEHTQQGTAGRTLLCFAAGLNLYFGDFQIPVTVFIPDEFVDGGSDIIEAVVCKTFFHFHFRALQCGNDPAVSVGIRQVSIGDVSTETAVFAFGIHQHEAGGIPQLIAEVAIAFAATQIEVDIAAQRSVAGHRETQRIRTIGRNTVREFFTGCFVDAGCLFRIHQTHSTFANQIFQLNTVDQINRI